MREGLPHDPIFFYSWKEEQRMRLSIRTLGYCSIVVPRSSEKLLMRSPDVYYYIIYMNGSSLSSGGGYPSF